MEEEKETKNVVTICQQSTQFSHVFSSVLLCFHLAFPGAYFSLSCHLFPQQRELMGSSAQISSGVCRCGLQEEVPEKGSGRLRRGPAYAGVGSGGRFQKVPESSGVK